MSILTPGQEAVRLTVPAAAVPASRPRVTKYRTYYGGPYGTFLPWLRSWAAENWPGKPLEGPLSVRIGCVLVRPPSHFRKGKNAHLLTKAALPYPPGDVDNYAKGVLDGLGGVVFVDDGQVAALAVGKLYGPQGVTFVQIERAATGDPFGCFDMLPGLIVPAVSTSDNHAGSIDDIHGN
jgi:Holliday junction resolvase RusA-like endonuclease